MNLDTCHSFTYTITIQDGASPLYAASQEGHTDVVDILVKAGADVNQATTVVCLFELGVRDTHVCMYISKNLSSPSVAICSCRAKGFTSGQNTRNVYSNEDNKI